MNQSDFKQIGEILKKLDSAASSSGDQATLLRSIKTDLRGISGRLGIVEDHIDILKQEVRETKERSEEMSKDIKQIKDKLGEVHETVDALFVDMVDAQKQIGGIYDEIKVVGDKWNDHGQRISHLETHVGILAE